MVSSFLEKEEQNLQIYTINTAFLTSYKREEDLSTGTVNVINALKNSVAYPELKEEADKTYLTWEIYNNLLLATKTDKASKSLTRQKLQARKTLVYEMLVLVWKVQINGENNFTKLTGDTGLTVKGIYAKLGPITVAPRGIKIGAAMLFDSNSTSYALPVFFGRDQNRPKNIKGASYRFKLEDEDAWSEPINFMNNRKRVMSGLKKDAIGVFQVRYNGGSTGNGPWSMEIPFAVLVP